MEVLSNTVEESDFKHFILWLVLSINRRFPTASFLKKIKISEEKKYVLQIL